MLTTDHPAAEFVRQRLSEIDAPMSQEQMQVLIDDLKEELGHTPTRSDVIEVVAAFQDAADSK